MECTIGKKLNGTIEYPRDAVHVPIIRLIAGEKLEPGQKIKLKTNDDIIAISLLNEQISIYHGVGVVDPYLETSLNEGDGFWCFIKPGNINDMTHHWVSNKFPNTKNNTINTEDDHEKFLKEFCKTNFIDFETLIKTSMKYSNFLEEMLLNPENYDMDEEFWDHLEKYTGMKFDEDDRYGPDFSCMGC